RSAGRTAFPWRRHVDALVSAKCKGAEHAPNRLRKTFRGVLRSGIGVGKAAIPGRRPPKLIRGDLMNRKGGERGGGRDEQEYEKAIIRAATFGDRRDGKPGNSLLHRHLSSGEASDGRRKRIDDDGGKNAREQAESGENSHG